MAGRKRVGIYSHGNGGWRFQVKDPKTGKWKLIAATRKRFEALRIPHGDKITKTDAFRLKQRYEEILNQAEEDLPQKTELNDAIADYLKYQRNEKDFLAAKRRVLEEFSEVTGDVLLGDVTKVHLADFERYLIDRHLHGKGKLHNNTVARYLKYVRMFFNYSLREGWITRSPFINFSLPKEEPIPIKPYSLEEIGKVVEFLRETDRGFAVWMTAGFVGLGVRSIELRGLKWEDFDQEERFVHIKESKNLESKRPQPVPLCLMPLFEENQKDEGPMFPFQNGEENTRTQMVNFSAAVAKRFKGFNWGRFRKTYSTLLQNAGVDSLIIDRLLGHSSRSSSIRVSARYYIGKEYEFYRGLVDVALEPLGQLFLKT